MGMLAIFLLLGVIDPLGYAIAKICGLPEAKGWKKVVPFCWMFA